MQQKNKMHSSNSTNCNYTPPFPENDINNTSSTTSKLHDDPCNNNFFFNFPTSPHIHMEYEDVYRQFLDIFDQHKPDHHANTPATSAAAAPEANHENAAALEEQRPASTTAVRKRCCKKDRHSKINTARGPRDRRMRLSLEVARKFFDLQDLLGYDKASRTVDWLLKNSRSAIRELARSSSNGGGGRCSLNMGATAHSGSVSTSSDGCEVVSSSNHSTTATAAAEDDVAPGPPPATKTKRSRKNNVKVARATVARESRTRARERARERTSQKRRLGEITPQPKIFDEQLFSKSYNESAGSSRVPMQAAAEFDEFTSDETRINPLPYSVTTWNPLHNYQENAGLISHQHEQIAEFEYCGKVWEAYSSFNLSG